MQFAIQLAEKGLFPDGLIRFGIRRLLAERSSEINRDPRSTSDWIQELENRPLAEDTDAANAQHYEVPAAYFVEALGEHLKYSSGFWPNDDTTLDESEAAMLLLSCEHAQLEDGQEVLELGCGWGSLSLWMAENYPSSKITSISNSNSQREFIESHAQYRGLTNLTVITCDINDFAPEKRFDRIVSVEMFEHVRNHRKLLKRIDSWLIPGGKLFVHIFAHQRNTYLFEVRNDKDWMSKYFFTGGIMPSADLLPTAAETFEVEEQWQINGQHYSRTLEAWLQKQDAKRAEIMAIFREAYGNEAGLWFHRWRLFYMACSELFNYNSGNDWMVMHYRFSKPA